MRKFVHLMLLVVGVSSISGCHCLRCTDDVMDDLDDLTTLNDYHRGLDHLYCEQLDVTRWCMHGPCNDNECR